MVVCDAFHGRTKRVMKGGASCAPSVRPSSHFGCYILNRHGAGVAWCISRPSKPDPVYFCIADGGDYRVRSCSSTGPRGSVMLRPFQGRWDFSISHSRSHVRRAVSHVSMLGSCRRSR